MTTQLRALRACVGFLTRIPVGGFPYSDAEWRWAPAYLPVVGAGIGLAMALVYLLATALQLGETVAAVLALALGLRVTGALHEDGLADTADALGAAADSPERLRAILKDSALGTYGALALLISMLLRVALLARLDVSAPLALVLAQSLSRVTPLWIMATLPYVTDPHTARSGALASRTERPQALVGSLAATAIALAIGASVEDSIASTAACLTLVLGVAWLCRRCFARVLGGTTGDFLGASQQLAECGVLLTLASLAPTA